MSILRTLLFSLAVLSVAVSLPAQSQSTESGSTGTDTSAESTDAQDPGQDNRKKYLVEVITFQYLGPDTSGGETYDQLLVGDYLPSRPFNFDDYNRVREAVSYTDMKVLSGSLEKLRLNERYRILTNVAWVQPLLGKNEAVEVPVGQDSSTGQTNSEGLSGSIRVYGDYLLFLELNLRMALPTRMGDNLPATSTESGSTSVISGSQTSQSRSANRLEVFHLSEKRRIKLEEFHYFDHPFFGAIVSVVRYEDS